MVSIKEQVTNAKTDNPFGITRLIAREHKTYNGPVFRLPSGSLWIFYKDQPLEVFHMPSSLGWTHVEAEK